MAIFYFITPFRRSKLLLDGDKVVKSIRKDKIRLSMKKRNDKRTKLNKIPFRSLLDTLDDEMEMANPISMFFNDDGKDDDFKRYESTPTSRKLNDIDHKKSTPKRRTSNEIDHNESTPKRRKFNDIDLDDPDPHENWKGMVTKSSRTYENVGPVDFIKGSQCRKSQEESRTN